MERGYTCNNVILFQKHISLDKFNTEMVLSQSEKVRNPKHHIRITSLASTEKRRFQTYLSNPSNQEGFHSQWPGQSLPERKPGLF
jgi:hypothetical protein